MITRGLIYASQDYRGEATPAAGVLSLDRSREHNDGTETDITYSKTNNKLWYHIFNGSSSYIATPTFPCFTSENFSLTAWIYLTSIANIQPIFVHGESGFLGWGWRFIVYDGALQFSTFQAAGALQTTGSDTIIATNTWYQVGFTRSGAVAKVFANGADVTLISTAHVDPDPFTSPANIGWYVTKFFTGRMALINLYKRPFIGFPESFVSEKSLFGG